MLPLVLRILISNTLSSVKRQHLRGLRSPSDALEKNFPRILLVPTFDVELPFSHSIKLRTRRNRITRGGIDCAIAGLEEITKLMNEMTCPATYFLEGIFGRILGDKAKNLLRHGSEIGSHGYSHESYARFWPTGNWNSNTELDEHLKRSISVIKQISGQDVRSFRAPFLALEERWLMIMHKYGIIADSSLYNIAYGLSATPYRPSFDELSRPGAAPVLEVPITVYPRSKKIPLRSPYVPILEAEESQFRRFLNTLRNSCSNETIQIIVTIFHPWELFEGDNRAKSFARVKLDRLVDLIEITRESDGCIMTVKGSVNMIQSVASNCEKA